MTARRLLGALAFLALAGCKPQPTLHPFAGQTMGTTYSVKIVSTRGALDEEFLKQTWKTVEERLEEVNRKMSTYRPDSELSLLNAHSGGSPFEVSAETLTVIRAALDVSRQTSGAFDITAAPLVNAWGFGPRGGIPDPPGPTELTALRERIGYQKLTVSAEDSSVEKARDDIHCDLSAIAKGYAVDRVAEALDALGLENYMVEVGGEIRTRGVNDREVPWRIGIEEPDPVSRSSRRIVPISGVAVATSGDYRNYREVDGRRVIHIMDPRTFRPIQHGLASVTVIHPTCALADAYATAIMVLGPEEGYRFAVEKDLAVFLIVREEEGFTRRMTPAFERHTESGGARS